MVPRDYEMYALSFDAVIDYMEENGQSALTATMEQLKCFFLQKIVAKPT